MKKTKADNLKNKRDLPQMQVRASFMPESIDVEARTVRMQYTTGARVYRGGFWEEPYYEELSTKKGEVRLDRLQNGAPLLNSHNQWSLDAVCGVIEDADEEFCTVRFARDEESEIIFQKVKDGILRHVSVGYIVHRFKDITGSDDKVRVLRAVDWEPLEVSIVSVPADAGAGIRANGQKYSCIIESEETNKGEKTMTEEEKKAAARRAKEAEARAKGKGRKDEEERAEDDEEERAEDMEDEDEVDDEEERAEDDTDKKENGRAAAKAAVKAERQRVQQVTDACRAAKMPDAFREEAIAKGTSIDKVRAAIIDSMAEKQEGGKMTPQITTGTDQRGAEAKRAVEACLLHRFNPGKYKLPEGAVREFRGYTLMETARRLLEMRGVSTHGMNKLELASRALHTTSDFPEILANVAGKTLRDAYQEVPRTFQAFCRQATLPDFKQVSRTQLSEAPNLDKVLEGGEFKFGTVGEGAEKYQLSTFGKILSFSRQMLINDDMDAFSRIPSMMGAAAARLESDIVYGILLNNPDMADGIDLFHDDHGNLTDALLDVDGMGIARALMRKQKGPAGLARLNLTPKYLLVGSDLETKAAKLQTETVPNKTDDANPWRNSFQTIVESRLDDLDDGSNFILAADPSQIDTIEYGYLDGAEGVYLETEVGFLVDGISMKARHDFAAKAIDYRGFVKSTNDAEAEEA